MANRQIIFQIYDTNNVEVFHQNDAKSGTYTFTPSVDGLALFCFNDQANKDNGIAGMDRLVSVTIDHGTQKKDYEAIAKKEQLEVYYDIINFISLLMSMLECLKIKSLIFMLKPCTKSKEKLK